MSKKNQIKTHLLPKITINICLLVFCMSVIYPMFFMLINSVKTRQAYNDNIFNLPHYITLDNFMSIFSDYRFFQALINSFYNSIISTIFVLFSGYIIGFFLARYEFIGKKLMYALFFFALLVPIPALMTPLFLQFKDMGLYNKPYSLLLPYMTFNISLSVFLFESYIRSISNSLDESAFVDGANIHIVIFKIIMPICAPVVATVCILTFLNTWNEFSFALILIRSEKFATLPIWLSRFKGERTIEYPQMIAGMLLASLPVILVYLRFSRKIMEGLPSGAVKG